MNIWGRNGRCQKKSLSSQFLGALTSSILLLIYVGVFRPNLGCHHLTLSLLQTNSECQCPSTMQIPWSRRRLFFLISTFFVLIEKKNLNIMIISYCSPFQSGKSFTLHQQMGFLEISRNIKHIRKRNYIFLKRDDNTICIRKLKTQTLSGRSGISASWMGTVIQAPSLYAYLLCNGWAGRACFCPGASVFKSPNQISSSSKGANLLALSP